MPLPKSKEDFEAVFRPGKFKWFFDVYDDETFEKKLYT
jgi:hypothetical protein